MEILVSIIGLVLKGVFSLIGISVGNTAKTEAEARKKEVEGILETTDAERAITEKVKEVEREGVKIEDIFTSGLPIADIDPVL